MDEIWLWSGFDLGQMLSSISHKLGQQEQTRLSLHWHATLRFFFSSLYYLEVDASSLFKDLVYAQNTVQLFEVLKKETHTDSWLEQKQNHT